MKVTSLQWDADNIRHFNEHGRCTKSQVEDVLASRCKRSRVQEVANVGGETRYRFHGETCAGRFLVVIAAKVRKGELRPITCWPLVNPHRARYLAWRTTTAR